MIYHELTKKIQFLIMKYKQKHTHIHTHELDERIGKFLKNEG